MAKEKTICEIEFEKWWESGVYKGIPQQEEYIKWVWNQAWKTCSDKTRSEVKYVFCV